MNSGIPSNRAPGGPGSPGPICSCSAQGPPGTCTGCESAREQLRAPQGLLKSKILINASILWKMRPVFEKCSWLITHMTHTNSLRITPARKSSESIESAVWLRVAWMTSLSRCFRRYDLTKNIKNLPGFCEFCSLTPSRLSFKLSVNTLTLCGCIRLPEAMR